MQQRSARRAIRRSMRLGRAIRSSVERLEGRLLLSTYTVTSAADSGPGTLRDAISNSSADTIQFSVAGPILLNSQLEISRSLTISGPGVGQLTVSGNQTTRVFQVDPGISAEIDGLTISNGRASDFGAGVFNQGTLHMTASAVTNNIAGGSGVGGGIANAGTLTLTNVTISSNSAGGAGGGIINAGTTTLSNCALSGNTAQSGGAIQNTGHLTVSSTSVSSNHGTGGGGIENAPGGSLVVTTSSISSNTASANGGGIENAAGAVVVLTASTVSRNAAASGGGVCV